MDWLDKLIGRNRSGASPVPDHLSTFKDALASLDEAHPELAIQTAQYVLTGEGAQILLTLEQEKQKLAAIVLSRTWTAAGPTGGPLQALMARSDWPADILRRFGQVFAIARGSALPIMLSGSARSPAWLRALLLEYDGALSAAEAVKQQRRTSVDVLQPLTVAKLQSLLVEDEAPDCMPILDNAFELPSGRRRFAGRQTNVEDMPDFEAFLRSNREARCAELRRLSPSARAQGLQALAKRRLNDGPWFELAFELAADPSKTVRDAAQILLRTSEPGHLARTVEARFAELKGAQQTELARAVVAVCGEPGIALVERLAAGKLPVGVAAELRRLIGQQDLDPAQGQRRIDGAEGYLAVDGSWIEPASPMVLPPDLPVTPALRQLIDEAFAAWRVEVDTRNRETQGKPHFYRQSAPALSATDRFCALVDPDGDALHRTTEDDVILNLLKPWLGGKERQAIVTRIGAHPDLTLWHLLRAARGSQPGSVYWRRQYVQSNLVRARLTPGMGLRSFSDICGALGDAPDAVMRYALEDSWHPPDFSDWPRDDVWPYFIRHFGLFDEALGLAPVSSAAALSTLRAFELLALFPKTPARYFAALVDCAVGNRKTVRQAARDLLSASPRLDELLTQLLTHSKQEPRGGAAAWLADRGTVTALPELQKAAAKEKTDSARAALLGAISRLGGDIGGFLSADKLLQEARVGLKKAPPKEIQWLPFEILPPLRQADRTLLDPDVLRWWLALAAKANSPRADAWFELLLDHLEPACAEQLSNCVLQTWVAFDTARPSEMEANAHASQNIAGALRRWRRWKPSITRDEVFALVRNGYLRGYRNNGIHSKGVLALAARASGLIAESVVRGYFKEHYARTAQCKALLECLAANPSPVAIQFVLSIAKRWRTRTVQETAAQMVQAIADRRGWSEEQLADRTVPTGGFDESGHLIFDLDGRVYTGRLDERNKIQLFNPDGKPVQGLPAPPAGEKSAGLTEAKAALSNARKEIKQVFDFQPKRLYEAMCIGREWPSEEWAEHLLRHPLVGRLAQRLVWLGLDEAGGQLTVFRPLADLSLTDVADREVDLAGLRRIRLAHSTMLTPTEIEAWQSHFKDYRIAPLFDQLARPVLTLSADQDGAAEILDRRGWLIDAFKLRGTAGKFGYARGSAQDGGRFWVYEKPFAATRLAAVLEFTGNSLPEENRLTALTGLHFVRMTKAGGLSFGKRIALKDVPAVLVSEAWNDFHGIAAAGAGYAEDWEKQAAW